MNYIQQTLNEPFQDCKMLTRHMMPTRFLSISFEGWEEITILMDNPTFSFLMDLVILNLQAIISKYKDTHAFEQPHWSYNPQDTRMTLSLGIMELKRYEAFLKLNENETFS